jgi:hypothetical protein
MIGRITRGATRTVPSHRLSGFRKMWLAGLPRSSTWQPPAACAIADLAFEPSLILPRWLALHRTSHPIRCTTSGSISAKLVSAAPSAPPNFSTLPATQPQQEGGEGSDSGTMDELECYSCGQR